MFKRLFSRYCEDVSKKNYVKINSETTSIKPEPTLLSKKRVYQSQGAKTLGWSFYYCKNKKSQPRQETQQCTELGGDASCVGAVFLNFVSLPVLSIYTVIKTSWDCHQRITLSVQEMIELEEEIQLLSDDAFHRLVKHIYRLQPVSCLAPYALSNQLAENFQNAAAAYPQSERQARSSFFSKVLRAYDENTMMRYLLLAENHGDKIQRAIADFIKLEVGLTPNRFNEEKLSAQMTRLREYLPRLKDYLQTQEMDRWGVDFWRKPIVPDGLKKLRGLLDHDFTTLPADKIKTCVFEIRALLTEKVLNSPSLRDKRTQQFYQHILDELCLFHRLNYCDHIFQPVSQSIPGVEVRQAVMYELN